MKCRSEIRGENSVVSDPDEISKARQGLNPLNSSQVLERNESMSYLSKLMVMLQVSSKEVTLVS